MSRWTIQIFLRIRNGFSNASRVDNKRLGAKTLKRLREKSHKDVDLVGPTQKTTSLPVKDCVNPYVYGMQPVSVFFRR